MAYDITNPTAPVMPCLGKGTEIVKLLLSQASKDMQKPLFSMLFLSLAHISSVRKNQCVDHIWKDL